MAALTPKTCVMDQAGDASGLAVREKARQAGPGPGAGGRLGSASGPRTGLPGMLDRPLTSYYLILGITTLLLALGLIMVLSTSSVAQLDQGGSPFSAFQHQLVGVAIGIPCMWLAARSSPTVVRAAAYPLMFLAILGLLLIPLLPGAGILSLLVMLGDDLGTTFLLLVIFLALLWVIGTPLRMYAGILGLIGLILLILIVVAKYRFQRLTLFLHPQGGPLGPDMQGIQGKWAVGSGGWFGMGLGASRQKWGYVPNDTTDFIFAIIGEELGLVGSLCVSLLYGGLAYAGLRIARRVQDTFVRLAAAGATAWIVVEAIVNIGAVLGLLPITGGPLPLVSYGLSSLLVTVVALGMLMSFAKREPGAEHALAAAGPGAARRTLSWLGLDRL